MVYKISSINEQQISQRGTSLKDHTDEISISFFRKLVDKIKEKAILRLTDLRVSKFMNTWLLKTTKTSAVSEVGKVFF